MNILNNLKHILHKQRKRAFSTIDIKGAVHLIHPENIAYVELVKSFLDSNSNTITYVRRLYFKTNEINGWWDEYK